MPQAELLEKGNKVDVALPWDRNGKPPAGLAAVLPGAAHLVRKSIGFVQQPLQHLLQPWATVKENVWPALNDPPSA